MLGLGYLHTQLAVDASGVATDDLDIFRTHFTFTSGPDRPPDATLVLRRTARHRVPSDAARVVLRRGCTERFTVRARLFRTSGELRLVCEDSGTHLVFDVGQRVVRFDVPGSRPGRELIEVVHSLVLRNEENHGVVVAHAAVVELGGRAVIIAGPDGAGDALDLVVRHEGRLVSGCKALLLPGSGGTGDVLVAGWPDVPPVGAPRSRRSELPLASPGRRLPVAAVVYPSLSPDALPGLTPCGAHAHRFAALVESSFDSGTFGWNPLVERSPSLASFVAIAVSRVGELPAYELAGSGSLAPAEVAQLLG